MQLASSRAAAVADAKTRAMRIVESEWSQGGECWAHGDDHLSIEVESVHGSSCLESLSFANRGYTLYAVNEIDA